MDKLVFVGSNADDSDYLIENVISFRLNMDMDAACDGLKLEFNTYAPVPELVSVRVYYNGELIFFGYVDTQQDYSRDDGTGCFIFARSLACVLTDNEATPCTYRAPNALALFDANARALGFSCELPMIATLQDYEVTKGTSCFGAINDFVEGITGKRIIVDHSRCIRLLQSDRRYVIYPYQIISEKRIINRGDAVARIDYKIGSEKGYDHHIKSNFFEKKGIVSSKKKNLASIPAWQRDYALLAEMKSNAQNYSNIEIVIDSDVDFRLGDVVDLYSEHFGEWKNMVVLSVSYILDNNFQRTRLVLASDVDMGVVTYVD